MNPETRAHHHTPNKAIRPGRQQGSRGRRTIVLAAIGALIYCGVSRPSPGCCSHIQPLNIIPPLRCIRTQHAPIICHQSVDLSLDVRRLRPDTAATGEELDLLPQLAEEYPCAVVVSLEVCRQFVRLVDAVERLAFVPQAGPSLSAN